ncbi:MAG: hypothetical protein MUF15_11935 [Acidobacteria bacterium]|jgi:hypothetical protein|nr:hypothetical protein [Acidobacteriota bacterium]
MRLHKNQVFKVFVLSVICLWFCGPLFTQPGVPQSKNLEEMYNFVSAQLPAILANIPANEEDKFGFKNREEFRLASLGLPYQEYSLDKDTPTGYWRVPVTVSNENRALLRLKMQNGQWTFDGLGAAVLARELGFMEKFSAGDKPAWGRIARDFEMQCDYVQYNPTSESTLSGYIYPLESAARLLLRANISIEKRGFHVTEIRAFRSKFLELSGKFQSAEAK